MSGGQQQRVMIAMAIACEPKLLIADEPTTALDVTIQKQILDLIAELQKKHQMSVLFITHDLAVVGEIADHVVVMRNGEIREQGTGEAGLRGAAGRVHQGAAASAARSSTRRPMRLPVIDDFMNGSPRAATNLPDRTRGVEPGDPIVLDGAQPRQELLFARGPVRQARVQGGEERVVRAAARARRWASSASRARARRRSA